MCHAMLCDPVVCHIMPYHAMPRHAMTKEKKKEEWKCSWIHTSVYVTVKPFTPLFVRAGISGISTERHWQLSGSHSSAHSTAQPASVDAERTQQQQLGTRTRGPWAPHHSTEVGIVRLELDACAASISYKAVTP